MKKQKQLRLSPEDLALLEKLGAEMRDAGVDVTDSDIVALGLKQIEEQGGLIAVLQKRKEGQRGKKKSA